MNQKDTINDLIDAIETKDPHAVEDVELFGDELEDRFNAKIVSTLGTAGTLGSTASSVSTACSAY